MDEREVWLRVYAAALAGLHANPSFADKPETRHDDRAHADGMAADAAEMALGRFRERFSEREEG